MLGPISGTIIHTVPSENKKLQSTKLCYKFNMNGYFYKWLPEAEKLSGLSRNAHQGFLLNLTDTCHFSFQVATEMCSIEHFESINTTRKYFFKRPLYRWSFEHLGLAGQI